MTTTTNHEFPYLAEGQAQKHVTVNETIRKLDAVVQLTVESATTIVEPDTPSDGQTYIIPPGKTGTSWAAFTNNAIGYYRDGAWEQITPREGWLAWVRDDEELVVYNGTGWDQVTSGTLGTAAAEDIGTSGANVPLLNAVNTWGDNQYFSGAVGVGTATPNKKLSVTEDIAFGEDGAARATSRYIGVGDAGLTGFWKAAMEVDAIGVNGIQSDFAFHLKSGDLGGSPLAEYLRITSAGAVQPGADNAYSCGAASFRWSVVYAGTGTINTSDAREKTPLRALNARERAAILRILGGIGIFQWRDALAAKGPDPAAGGARLHCGVTAQAVRDAFAAEGLDAESYGLFCADGIIENVVIEPSHTRTEARPDGQPVETSVPDRIERRPVIDPHTGEPHVRLGVRYDQLFAMALGALALHQQAA